MSKTSDVSTTEVGYSETELREISRRFGPLRNSASLELDSPSEWLITSLVGMSSSSWRVVPFRPNFNGRLRNQRGNFLMMPLLFMIRRVRSSDGSFSFMKVFDKFFDSIKILWKGLKIIFKPRFFDVNQVCIRNSFCRDSTSVIKFIAKDLRGQHSLVNLQLLDETIIRIGDGTASFDVGKRLLEAPVETFHQVGAYG